jgi:hypothetical protein
MAFLLEKAFVYFGGAIVRGTAAPIKAGNYPVNYRGRLILVNSF